MISKKLCFTPLENRTLRPRRVNRLSSSRHNRKGAQPIIVYVRAEGRPLFKAVIDVWQAAADGAYDNMDYNLRGKPPVNTQGGFQLRTMIPGHSLSEDTYRPAHIHVKVEAPGQPRLTAQLYFDGDPHNAIDTFIRQSLTMPLNKEGKVISACFNFVLVASLMGRVSS